MPNVQHVQCTNILHSLNKFVGCDFDKKSLFCYESDIENGKKNNFIRIEGKALGTNMVRKGTSYL